jgi:modulator of FtsH protease HflK
MAHQRVAANRAGRQESGLPKNDGPEPGPWGTPPGGGGNGSNGGSGGGSGGGPFGGPPRPPPQRPRPRSPWQGAPRDMDELLERLQDRLRRMLPGGPQGWRGLAIVAAALVAIWAVSGFYRVQPDEEGVVMRFGAYDRTTWPGLNYHLPWPIETVERPAVTVINKIEIGFRSNDRYGQGSGAQRNVLEESQMLTGDENIIDIEVVVFWKISDPVAYLFNVREPPDQPAAVIKAVAESSLREVVGRTPIQPILAEARAQVEGDVLKATQTILDSYKAGVEITQIQLQRVDPPTAVIDSFRDVQRANTEADRARNEAQAYRNDIVPRARGLAAAMIAGADADRQAAIAEATGQTQRFLLVLNAYRISKTVTLRRMYIDTMQDVLTHASVTIVDDALKGLLPVLQVGTGSPPSAPVPTPEALPPATTAPQAPSVSSATGVTQ